jgi:hypothetical protein
MTSTPAIQSVQATAEVVTEVPTQAVLDRYMLRAKALADELAALFGGSGEVNVLIHRADPERYHALPHPPVVFRNDGATHAWRVIARIGHNTNTSVFCRDSWVDGPGCTDIADADTKASA